MVPLIDKLQINDPRVEQHTININDKNYHYILGNPSSGSPIDTIFLIHGCPDLGHGWRYQVPLLLSLNYRVVVPDMLGYGKTDCPEDLSQYAMKSMVRDTAELAAHIVGENQQIILGGHDWGGQRCVARCSVAATASQDYFQRLDPVYSSKLGVAL